MALLLQKRAPSEAVGGVRARRSAVVSALRRAAYFSSAMIVLTAATLPSPRSISTMYVPI
jgi:hypothetical protein